MNIDKYRNMSFIFGVVDVPVHAYFFLRRHGSGHMCAATYASPTGWVGHYPQVCTPYNNYAIQSCWHYPQVCTVYEVSADPC